MKDTLRSLIGVLFLVVLIVLVGSMLGCATAYAERPYTGQVVCLFQTEQYVDGKRCDCDSVCSGSFVVISDKHVLTNYHVVADPLRAREFGKDGKVTLKFFNDEVSMAEVVKIDAVIDLALLELERGLPLGVHRIALADKFEAETLTWSGYAYPQWYVSRGYVTSVEEQDGYLEGARAAATAEFMGKNWVRFDARVFVGHSGGPVINEQGKLVGLVWGSEFPTENKAYGIRIEAIHKFLEK